MRPELPPYLTPSSRNGRRRSRQAGRRHLALAIVIFVVAAAAVAWMTIMPGSKRPVTSTSTSAMGTLSTSASTTQAPSSSTTSTSQTALTTASTGTSLTTGSLTYSAILSGQNEIPVLSTSASGTLTLTVAADGSSVSYVFMVSEIANLTLARLREGKAGATGTTILTIYGGPTRSDVFSGVVTQGSFTADQLGGSLRGKAIADFVSLIKAGSVYFNVGTTSHPAGELRGQLK
jgi:hypothetical protein